MNDKKKSFNRAPGIALAVVVVALGFLVLGALFLDELPAVVVFLLLGMFIVLMAVFKILIKAIGVPPEE